MRLSVKFRALAGALSVVFGAATVLAAALFPAEPEEPGARQQASAEPWSSAEILKPDALAGAIKPGKDAKPAVTIVYVGFRTLFEGAHVPGAVFHGTASSATGMAELRKWLADQPRSVDIVIYCGCCPFDHCPNIRPAYKALREMGFEKVRVVVMPTSFNADWVEKGYPIEKGM